jgi:hypothetical protein
MTATLLPSEAKTVQRRDKSRDAETSATRTFNTNQEQEQVGRLVYAALLSATTYRDC